MNTSLMTVHVGQTGMGMIASWVRTHAVDRSNQIWLRPLGSHRGRCDPRLRAATARILRSVCCECLEAEATARIHLQVFRALHLVFECEKGPVSWRISKQSGDTPKQSLELHHYACLRTFVTDHGHRNGCRKNHEYHLPCMRGGHIPPRSSTKSR